MPDVSPDVVLLAGDIDRGLRGLRWSKEHLPEVPIIYVLGNHEYYGEAFPRLLHKLAMEADALGARFHVLNRDSVEIEGVHFVGTTLWTDYALFGDPRVEGPLISTRLSDFKRIRADPTYRRVRPDDFAAVHARDVTWITEQLGELAGETTVVITHHAPSARSLDGPRAQDPVSAAYASNLDDLVASSGARLWVHGHIHHPSDYRIGSTRVLSNPRGYIDEPVSGFRPDLIVSV